MRSPQSHIFYRRSAWLFSALVLTLPASANAAPNACALLLSRELEQAALWSGTSKSQSKAVAEWMDTIAAFGDGGEVSKASLNSAWYRISFGKTTKAFVEYATLTEKELGALLFDSDARKIIRGAYAIRHFRMQANELFRNVALRVSSAFKRRIPSTTKPRAYSKLQYIFLTGSLANSAGRPDILTSGLSRLGEEVYKLFGFLSPVGLPIRWVRHTENLFLKLEKNPNLILTASEKKLLKKYHAVAAFNERRAYLLEHPTWPKTFRIGHKLADATFFTATVGGGIAILALEIANEPQSVEDYLASAESELKANQVQILNESFPFPHLSIRIGGKVYSYGETHLSVTETNTYFRNDTETDGVLSRAVQAVTLNLTPDEVMRLERHLVSESTKHYENITFVNDRSTLLVQALKETTRFSISTLLDPSPSVVIGDLAIRKLSGSSEIGEHRLIVAGKNTNISLQLLRNLYVNVAEAHLYRKFIILHQVMRRDKNSIKGEGDLIRAETEGDPELRTLMGNRKKIQTSWSPEQREHLHERFKKRYEKVYADLETPNRTIFDYVGGIYKLETLSEYEKEILGETRMHLEDSLDDPEFRAKIEEFIEQLRTDEIE